MASGTEAAILRSIEAATNDGVIESDGAADEGTEVETEVTEETPESEEGSEEGTETGDEGAGDESEGDEGDETEEEGEEDADEEGDEGDEEESEEEDDEEAEVDPDLGPERDKNGQINRIPHPRVVKMVAKKVEKALGEVNGVISKVLGLNPGQVTSENMGQALQHVVSMRERLAGFDELEPIMRGDGDTFIKMLAEQNPKQYEKFLAVLESGFVPPSEQVAKDMPKPDIKVKLADGSEVMTYSQEQMDKREAFLRKQFIDEANKNIDKRIKPFEDKRTAEEKAAATQQELASRIKDMLTEAREDWTGFKENEEAIRAEYNKIPKTVPMGRALRQAWQKVVVEGKDGLKTSRKKIRQQEVDRLKKAPLATSTKGKGAKRTEVFRDEEGAVITDPTTKAIMRGITKARAQGMK